MEETIKYIVKKTFGHYPKPQQVTAINSFVCGKDIFIALPTGFGKTTCYGALPYIFDKKNDNDEEYFIIVVISPLESLLS